MKNKPESNLKQPDNVVAVRIDPVSGLLAKPNQPNGIIEYFRNNEVPDAEDTTIYQASNEENNLEANSQINNNIESNNNETEQQLAPVEEYLF